MPRAEFAIFRFEFVEAIGPNYHGGAVSDSTKLLTVARRSCQGKGSDFAEFAGIATGNS
jgi:hypothetical protein